MAVSKVTKYSEANVKTVRKHYAARLEARWPHGASAPGSSPGRGHCVVFLGKTLYSHSASLYPGV